MNTYIVGKAHEQAEAYRTAQENKMVHIPYSIDNLYNADTPPLPRITFKPARLNLK